MQNKRHTNSFDTTGRHHIPPLAKPPPSYCLTANLQCAYQSYKSLYTTPNCVNEMQKPKQSKRPTRIPKRMSSTTAYKSMTRSCCSSASPRPSQGMTQYHTKSLRYRVPRSQLHVVTKYDKGMPRNSRKFTHSHLPTTEGEDARLWHTETHP